MKYKEDSWVEDTLVADIVYYEENKMIILEGRMYNALVAKFSNAAAKVRIVGNINKDLRTELDLQ